MLVLNDVGASDDVNAAISKLLHFPFAQQVCEYVRGIAVVGGLLLGFCKLCFQLLDLVLSFLLNDLGEFLNLKLLLHLGLRSPALGARL